MWHICRISFHEGGFRDARRVREIRDGVGRCVRSELEEDGYGVEDLEEVMVSQCRSFKVKCEVCHEYSSNRS